MLEGVQGAGWRQRPSGVPCSLWPTHQLRLSAAAVSAGSLLLLNNKRSTACLRQDKIYPVNAVVCCACEIVHSQIGMPHVTKNTLRCIQVLQDSYAERQGTGLGIQQGSFWQPWHAERISIPKKIG